MLVIPVEKKIIKKPKSRIMVAMEAKIRYLNDASALIDILLFIIRVKDSIEKSSKHRKNIIKSDEDKNKIPEKKVKKIISINS